MAKDDTELDFLEDEAMLTQGRKTPTITPEISDEDYSFSSTSKQNIAPTIIATKSIAFGMGSEQVVKTSAPVEEQDPYNIKKSIIRGISVKETINIPDIEVLVPKTSVIKNVLDNMNIMTEEEALHIIMSDIDMDAVREKIRYHVSRKIKNGDFVYNGGAIQG